MPELVACGQGSGERWQRPLTEGETVRVGRAPKVGWAVPWDALMSREHVDLELVGAHLRIHCLETAKNPVYLLGKMEGTGAVTQTMRDASMVRPGMETCIGMGEAFRIGTTRFECVAESSDTRPPNLLEERSYKLESLRTFAFKNADRRLEALSQLPRFIWKSRSDEDFAARIVDLLLEATPHADAAAVVEYADLSIAQTAKPTMMRVATRSGNSAAFRPSHRLVLTSLHRMESILHVWSGFGDTGIGFTISDNLDWAFCVPVKSEACTGWCLYVSGKFQEGLGTSSGILSEDDLKGDLRFAELLAQFIGAIRQVRYLEHQQVGMSQYFSPMVMQMLTGPQTETVLAPRETDTTVLFCDVRGFSRKAEHAQNDLHGLLDRVSQALGVMTHAILDHHGVIADFQGDAALGFWGWPVAPADRCLPACRAALDIHAAFLRARNDPQNLLRDFQVGIGIAHGRAIAGKIGTDAQAKVGVFGPVVNLGSRLEGMTKLLRVPILLDEGVAACVREDLPRDVGRCRRLCHLRPQGMDRPLVVSELLPPYGPDCSLTDSHLAQFEQAVDQFQAGNWNDALDLLGTLPVRDRAKDFLMVYIAQSGYEPPQDWEGIVNLSQKS